MTRRFLMVLPVVVSSLVAVGAAGAGAQEPPPASRVAEFIAEDQARRVASSAVPDPLPELPEVSAFESLDAETRRAALDAIREYYRYRLSGYEHRRRVFAWQLLSSKIIFWVVILMVSAGICFSGVQFSVALRAVKPREANGGSGRSALETSFEAGTGGIKVSSPVLGVIILVISFLFFYMYLVHVYPISEIM